MVLELQCSDRSNIFVVSLSSLCVACGLMSFGCKRFVVVGSKVFALLPMSLCAGDPNLSEMGVFRYLSRARYGSRLSRVAYLSGTLLFERLSLLYH